MYLEAKETAMLYRLLSEKLGNDTTEAMFKYLDNKTERSVEATIKTLATKDDVHKASFLLKDDLHTSVAVLKDDLHNSVSALKNDLHSSVSALKEDIAFLRTDFHKQIAESKAENIKWMFIFWIGQVAATLAIILMFIKK